MGIEAREVARLLRIGRNTERVHRDALEAAGLVDRSIDELPELAVLKRQRSGTSPRRSRHR